MFHFHPPDPRSISDLNVEIIVDLVIVVDDLDTERFRIAEVTVVDPFNVKVFLCLRGPAGFE